MASFKSLVGLLLASLYLLDAVLLYQLALHPYCAESSICALSGALAFIPTFLWPLLLYFIGVHVPAPIFDLPSELYATNSNLHFMKIKSTNPHL